MFSRRREVVAVAAGASHFSSPKSSCRPNASGNYCFFAVLVVVLLNLHASLKDSIVEGITAYATRHMHDDMSPQIADSGAASPSHRNL